METDKRQLLEAAKEAKKYSYAPYSNFHVGAALYCKDGSIYTGCSGRQGRTSYTLWCLSAGTDRVCRWKHV